MNASYFQPARRREKGYRVRAVGWTWAVSDWLQLDQPQSGAGRVNVRSIPGQQRAWIQLFVAKCAIKDENSDSLYAFLNLFSRVHINSNSHNPSKTQHLFTSIALSQLPNQPALWSMRHCSESVLVVFHGQQTTDLIFLQLISAAWRRIPFLSVPQQKRIKMAPQREAGSLLATSVSSWLFVPLFSLTQNNILTQKKNLFHLYDDLCADPLAAYKICEILILLCNCRHVIWFLLFYLVYLIKKLQLNILMRLFKKLHCLLHWHFLLFLHCTGQDPFHHHRLAWLLLSNMC